MRLLRLTALAAPPVVGRHFQNPIAGDRERVRCSLRIEKARAWLTKWPVDLLVAAVRMRGMGGLQFLMAVRGHHPELAGILIGSEGDERVEMDAWRVCGDRR